MDWRRPHPDNGREKAGGPRGGDCAAFLERLTIKRGLVVSAKPSSLRRRTSVRRRFFIRAWRPIPRSWWAERKETPEGEVRGL